MTKLLKISRHPKYSCSKSSSADSREVLPVTATAGRRNVALSSSAPLSEMCSFAGSCISRHFDRALAQWSARHSPCSTPLVQNTSKTVIIGMTWVCQTGDSDVGSSLNAPVCHWRHRAVCRVRCGGRTPVDVIRATQPAKIFDRTTAAPVFPCVLTTLNGWRAEVMGSSSRSL